MKKIKTSTDKDNKLSIGVLNLALVKLQEFLESYPDVDSQVMLLVFYASTFIRYESFSNFFDSLPIIELRKQEPFINLSLDDERLVYEIFMRVFFKNL